MNISVLRRLSILFTLLCVSALATHPGGALAKGTVPPAAASAIAPKSAHMQGFPCQTLSMIGSPNPSSTEGNTVNAHWW